MHTHIVPHIHSVHTVYIQCTYSIHVYVQCTYSVYVHVHTVQYMYKCMCHSNNYCDYRHIVGSLILDESLGGQLYVKQIWVSDKKQDGLTIGVNFKE